MSVDSPSWQDFVTGWQLGIYGPPILAATVAGFVLGFLSVYVVSRRMVFASAAVTQSAGLGLAIGFYAALHLRSHISADLVAVCFSLVTALLLAVDSQRIGLTRETMLGLLYAFCSAAAVIVGSRITQEAQDLQAILFGSAVVVAEADVHLIVIGGTSLLILHLWWFRGFAFAAFDPISARVQGLPVSLLSAMLLLSLGLMVGLGAHALGALPVFGLSTLPGVAATLLVPSRLRITFFVAALIGAASGGFGYVFAFFGNLPVGAAQVTLATLFVVAAIIQNWAWAKTRQLVSRKMT